MKTDLEKFQAVNKCETIAQLQSLILEFADSDGNIQGRTRKFNAEKIAKGAMQYFLSEDPPSVLTREFGIRQQAMHIKHFS